MPEPLLFLSAHTWQGWVCPALLCVAGAACPSENVSSTPSPDASSSLSPPGSPEESPLVGAVGDVYVTLCTAAKTSTSVHRTLCDPPCVGDTQGWLEPYAGQNFSSSSHVS